MNQLDTVHAGWVGVSKVAYDFRWTDWAELSTYNAHAYSALPRTLGV